MVEWQLVGQGATGGRDRGEERATGQGLGTTATSLEAKEPGVRRAEASIRRQEGLLCGRWSPALPSAKGLGSLRNDAQ